MDFDDLKIGNGSVGAAHEANLESKDVEAKVPRSEGVLPSGGTDGGKTFVGGDNVKKLLDRLRTTEVLRDDDYVYGVTAKSGKNFFDDFLVDHTKITLKDKSYFFHMLAVMVDAGIPVVNSLKSLAKRTRNLRFRRVLNTVAYNAEHGSNVSDALSRFENVFDDAEIGVVRSGEATGRLNMMLFRLSDQLDRRNELNMKLWGAAVYPIAVLVVLLLVVVGMLVWVFPSLLRLLTEGGVSQADLPVPTKILIFLQNVVVNYWWAILTAGFGLYGVFLMYRSTDYGSLRWDEIKLKIPVLGELLRKVNVLRFVEILGLLIDAGLPMIRSLEITANSLTNRVYRANSLALIEHVRLGGKISEFLAQSEFLIPPEITQMFAVGERSASLGKIAEKVSEQYEKEIDNSLKKLMALFQPLMILVVGIFVALLALAIMAPIFNLSTTLGA